VLLLSFFVAPLSVCFVSLLLIPHPVVAITNLRIHGMYVRTYEVISKSFRTGRLEPELQMVQLSAARCCCIAIL
jgi:hypothetical protein